MEPHKFVIVAIIVIAIATIIFGAAMSMSNVEVTSMTDLVDEFQQGMSKVINGQNTRVSTIREQTEQATEEEQQGGEGSGEGGEGEGGEGAGDIGDKPAPSESWIEDAKLAHRIFGCSGLHYQFNGNGNTDYGEAVRIDCSGFVSYALYTHGLLTSSEQRFSSDGAWDSVDGVERIHLNEIQAGDIVTYSGHVQIYMGSGLAINWGSHLSAEDKYVGWLHYDPKTCTVDPVSHTPRSDSTIVAAYRVTK